MRRAVLWAALATSSACDPPVRHQALVTLRWEPQVGEALSRIRALALDGADVPRGSAGELALSADYVRAGELSFGALLDSDGALRLRLDGYDADGVLRLRQAFSKRFEGRGVERFAVVLRDRCIDRIPCERADDPDGGSEGPGDAGGDSDAACLLGTVLDCGSCGAACNLSHVTLATCVAGQCGGDCDDHYADCDEDLRANGCEIDLSSDPDHCGECRRTCPFRTCVDERCVFDCQPLGRVDETLDDVQVIPPNRLFGTQIASDTGGILAGLGVALPVGQLDTRFRLGLYEHDRSTNGPGFLLAQTSEMRVADLDRPGSGALAECGPFGMERLVADRAVLQPGPYWLFVIASGPLQVWARPITVRALESNGDVDYTLLEGMPTYPGNPRGLKELGDALSPRTYLVRTPAQN